MNSTTPTIGNGFKVAAWGALLDRIEQEQLEVHEIDLRFGDQLVMR